jgi:hypothetical protein
LHATRIDEVGAGVSGWDKEKRSVSVGPAARTKGIAIAGAEIFAIAGT